MKAPKSMTSAALLVALLAVVLAGESEAQSPEAQPPLEYRLGLVAITLTRGACEDGCPVYTVVAHGNGMVSYYGDENVSTIGQQIIMISPQAVKELLDAVYETGFMNMRDSYLSHYVPEINKNGAVTTSYRGATGSPRSIVIVTIERYSKQIVFQPEHAPSELIELADLIDELVHSDKMTKGR
jgi:hypothetical protein